MFKRWRRKSTTIILKIGILTVIVMADGTLGNSVAAIPKVPKDKDIVRAVETELYVDEGVASHLIDVSSDNGIVTLTGYVDNLLAKIRARELALAIKGVRSVINQIKVRTVVRPDDEIRSAVVKALARDPATDLYEVDVEVKDGVVTLSGEVDSWQEKRLAERVAQALRGVVSVNNRLIFKYRSDRPDEEILSDVRGALEWDARVYDELITVRVDDGKVTLEGSVGSAAEKDRAYAKSWVTGVREVDNRIQVTGATSNRVRGHACSSRSDEDTERAIKDALRRDPRVRVFHPEVEVANDVVTLAGIVDNLKARKVAEQDAKNTICVWRVKNYLKVRPAVLASDKSIEERVRTVLRLDPFVDRHNIGITVLNGKVYLYGTVDTVFESQQAGDAVSRINGVVEVNNNLVVRKAWKEREDREIKESIEDQLWWSLFVDSDAIHVAVEDGVATLTGIVDSWSQYWTAMANAYQGGAKLVRNRLKVKNESDQS